MKTMVLRGLILFATCIGVPMAYGQYGLDLSPEYPTYLRFEAVGVHVTLRNDSDHVLLVGGLREGVVLEFAVRRNDRDVPRTSKGLIVENMLIMPGQTKDIMIDLRPHYDFQSP